MFHCGRSRKSQTRSQVGSGRGIPHTTQKEGTAWKALVETDTDQIELAINERDLWNQLSIAMAMIDRHLTECGGKSDRQVAEMAKAIDVDAK